ncbi:MAG: YebC/PmpR family DNA-binding transcriptional regulator [Deltaproteobacteria bacterium]|nr:YebC/PmpR family DNA-binding transcriptional regulator [Deltaproteobacteria bacterium]
MSGHSKWSTIKRKKGAADAKRGKVFSKLIKELTIAARHGGGDPSTNPRLRTVVDKAKTANMPADNITRAIKRGTGEMEGITYEEISFEGYGPGGTAIFIEVVTDNRNRTVADIRHILNKNGGNLGEAHCVAWMFDRHGLIAFEKSAVSEDRLMDLALEAGAIDIRDADDRFEVVTEATDFQVVQDACKAAGLTAASAELLMEPKNTITLEGNDAEKMIKLMNALEDHDDIQNVYANFDIDDALMEQLAS